MDSILRKSRTKNFTLEEKRYFYSLLNNHWDILCCKLQGKQVRDAKMRAWESITEQFNKFSEIPRTIEQLKELKKNIKSMALHKLVEESHHQQLSRADGEIWMNRENLILEESTEDGMNEGALGVIATDVVIKEEQPWEDPLDEGPSMSARNRTTVPNIVKIEDESIVESSVNSSDDDDDLDSCDSFDERLLSNGSFKEIFEAQLKRLQENEKREVELAKIRAENHKVKMEYLRMKIEYYKEQIIAMNRRRELKKGNKIRKTLRKHKE